MPEVANTTDSRRSIAKCDASQYAGFGNIYDSEGNTMVDEWKYGGYNKEH